MSDAAAGRREGPGCTGCGAPLPAGEGLRDVTCAHCHVVQPHPEPLPAGHAVLMPGALSRALGRVVGCDGPDEVRVKAEAVKETTLPLESLLPVIPAERAVPAPTAGERVGCSS